MQPSYPVQTTSETPAQASRADHDLALLSIILGATSFLYSIFTGIPAIVLGIMALRQKTGDPAQAKLGILFGVLGSLLIIPVILLAAYFLRDPLKGQFSIDDHDRQYMVQTSEKLEAYAEKNGSFPRCTTGTSAETCPQWRQFLEESGLKHTYPTEFEKDSYKIEDRPAGTLVYAERTSCFIGVPAPPGYDQEEGAPPVDPDEAAALVFFHEAGRACFPAEKP